MAVDLILRPVSLSDFSALVNGTGVTALQAAQRMGGSGRFFGFNPGHEGAVQRSKVFLFTWPLSHFQSNNPSGTRRTVLQPEHCNIVGVAFASL